MRYTKNDLKWLKSQEPDFLPLAKKRANGNPTYVCPFCGNGSGEDGDGIARNVNSDDKDSASFKCFKCDGSFDTLALWAAYKGLDNKNDFHAVVEGLADYYGYTLETNTADTDIGKQRQNRPSPPFTRTQVKAVPAAEIPPSKPETKPELLTVVPEGIPQELKALPQWVGWKLEWKENKSGSGRWTKVPRQVDGYGASTTNPATWGTFENVLSEYQAGRFDGIGFVFTKDAGIIGVDFDHCIDKQTEDIQADVLEQIEALGGYCELSPSGEGCHVFIKGQLPRSVKSDAVEVYSDGRYFTVTGRGNDNAIIENQAGVERILAFAEKCRKAEEANKTAIAAENVSLPLQADITDFPADIRQIQDTGSTLESIKSFIASSQEQISDARAVEYLRKRGFTVEFAKRFGLGFCPGWYPPSSKSVTPTPRLIIPTSDNTGYFARDIRDDVPKGQNDYTKMKVGHMDIFNSQTLTNGNRQFPLHITEGEFDAMSIELFGVPTVALRGTGLTPLIALIQDMPVAERPKEVVIMLDNDKAGWEAKAALSKELVNLGIIVLPTPKIEGKDPNEALTIDPDKFKAAIMATSEERKAEYNKRFIEACDSELQDEIEANASKDRVPTGFTGLDILLDGGLRHGLYILGAISSLGKTTLALQIADQIAASGQDVLYFSLEMARTELMAKSISRLTAIKDPRSTVTTNDILDGSKYKDYSQERLDLIKSSRHEYIKNCGPHLIIYEGNGNINTEYIRECVEKHMTFTGNRPVVFVDYLQILAPSDPNDYKASDKQNVDKAVTALKVLSRNARIPVFALSSFNRENYHKTASMTAFKESGGIEYSSDVLFAMQYAGIDRDANGDARDLIRRNRSLALNHEPQDVQILVLKNRNGCCGTVNVRFSPWVNLFGAAESTVDRSDNPEYLHESNKCRVKRLSKQASSSRPENQQFYYKQPPSSLRATPQTRNNIATA